MNPGRPRRRSALLPVLLLAALGGCGGKAKEPVRAAAKPPAVRPAPPRPSAPALPAGVPPAAAALAARLPLERQVAQLFLVGFPGTGAKAPGVAALGRRDWGGVVLERSNFAGAGQLGGLVGAVGSVARRARHLPPLVVADQPGGADTAFRGLPPAPEPRLGARGASGASAARREAASAGQTLRRLGVRMTLAPDADVDVTGGALGARLFSADAAAVARLTAAQVAGYGQARMLSAPDHFPGQGAVNQDPDTGTASVGLGLSDLRARDELPFAAVARTAPAIVMSNSLYAAFDGVTPAGLLPAAVRELRDHVGFRGAVLSDDLEATLQPTGGTVGDAAVQALQAGDDLLYVSGDRGEQDRAYAAVLAAARSGKLPRARLLEALDRALALKARAGLVR